MKSAAPTYRLVNLTTDTTGPDLGQLPVPPVDGIHATEEYANGELTRVRYTLNGTTRPWQQIRQVAHRSTIKPVTA